MRLALKVVFATVFGVLLVLAIFGTVHVRREISLFDFDMRNDHRVIGDTLAACVASIWWLEGARRVEELIAHADDGHAELAIRWLHRDGRYGGEPGTKADPRVPPLDRVLQTVVEAGASETRLRTLVPVVSRGQLLGAVAIEEKLHVRNDFIRTSIRNTLLATLAILGVAGGAVLGLGVVLVGRPLDRLAAKARRVALGDLSSPLDLRQRDEIGQLAREMNAMCDRLDEANERTRAETLARLKAIEQLRHADRLITVGKLAAGVAHELGTPLNVIAGRAKMLRKNPSQATLVTDYASIIADQAERMAAIIRQLLDFARQRELKTSAVDLVGIARATTNLLEPLAKKHGVTLELDGADRLFVLGDAMLLEQVTSNLVNNAIQACRSGGKVELSIGIEAASAGARAAQAFLRVRDDGIGIGPEQMSRIFEPFFTTKDIGQGTGLGLSVAHGIVEEHGGSIRVESEPGRGSVFCVYLPTPNQEPC